MGSRRSRRLIGGEIHVAAVLGQRSRPGRTITFADMQAHVTHLIYKWLMYVSEPAVLSSTQFTAKTDTNMAGGAGGRRRIDRDIAKLIEKKYDVSMKDKLNEIIVKFQGPKDTAYEGGLWRVRVYLPENYPFKSPSIGFMNRIFHPNIDDPSGTVCLDVINQSWSALYDLTNVFDSFLPQLLTYPNPTDPLNGYAASLYLKSPDTFKKTVKDYISKYATQEALLDQETGCPSAECSELSDFSESEDESQENSSTTHRRDTPTQEDTVPRKRIKVAM